MLLAKVKYDSWMSVTIVLQLEGFMYFNLKGRTLLLGYRRRSKVMSLNFCTNGSVCHGVYRLYYWNREALCNKNGLSYVPKVATLSEKLRSDQASWTRYGYDLLCNIDKFKKAVNELFAMHFGNFHTR